MAVTSYCKMSPGLQLNAECKEGECKRCGWNPEVHAARLRALYAKAACGKLSEWGKK